MKKGLIILGLGASVLGVVVATNAGIRNKVLGVVEQLVEATSKFADSVLEPEEDFTEAVNKLDL